jgi:endonuclease/exonuclease/phosphatase family metal-dependent hydrolase
MTVRVTTFNVENMYNRYASLDAPWNQQNYEEYVMAVGLASVADRQGGIATYAITEFQRNNTAQAILDANPDVLAIQEVENLYTLRIFNNQYLDNYFNKMLLIDGDDPRGIDVGFMLRDGFPGTITGIRTHVDDGVTRREAVPGSGYTATGAIFSRDCLEVDVAIGGKTLTFLVNHLKAQDSTKASITRRKEQATAVASFAQAAVAAGRLPIVLGDLNSDWRKPLTPGDDSLTPLVSCPALKDPFPADTWTHYYEPDKTVSRLDYILVDQRLQVTGTDIVRKGLTTKCKQYVGDRYPTIGPANTEASDHCPTTVILEV